MKAIGSKINLTLDKDTEYYSMIADIVESDAVNQMREYIQHGDTSTFQHCINVSYYNYRVCKKLKLDARAGARAGLLHDLFLYDWHMYKPKKGEMLHGFTHAKRAYENAAERFELTALESDIIQKHMWPLTLREVPKYRETFVIVMVDKVCGLMEILDYRFREISYTFNLLSGYTSRFFSKIFGRLGNK